MGAGQGTGICISVVVQVVHNPCQVTIAADHRPGVQCTQWPHWTCHTNHLSRTICTAFSWEAGLYSLCMCMHSCTVRVLSVKWLPVACMVCPQSCVWILWSFMAQCLYRWTKKWTQFVRPVILHYYSVFCPPYCYYRNHKQWLTNPYVSVTPFQLAYKFWCLRSTSYSSTRGQAALLLCEPTLPV